MIQRNEGAAIVGTVLVVASALAFSLSGILTKAIEADGWTIGCWRGLIGGLVVMAYVELRRGRQARAHAFRLGPKGWLLASVGSVGSLTFIYAFKFTYVANVAVIYATAPFFAAALAWWLMREAAAPRTIAAAMVSTAGVCVIVAGSLGGLSLTGDLIAVAMTILNAIYIVLIRKFADVPVVWAGGASALQLFVVGLLVSNPLDVTTRDMVLLIAFGVVFATAIILWTEGTRLVPASQSALLGAAEIPFAAVLAYLLLNELPNRAGFAGGAIILGAVLGHTLLEMRRGANRSR